MICRLCLINLNVDTSVNIFNEVGNDGESKLVKIIAKYIHLEVTQQDEVSTAICQECHNHLTTFHKYCEFVEKQQSTLNNKFLVVEFDEQVITPNVVGAAELQESMDVQLKCEPEEELVAEAFAMRNDKDNASISSHSSEPSSTWDSQHDMRAKADLLSQAFNTQPPKTVFGRLQSIEEFYKSVSTQTCETHQSCDDCKRKRPAKKSLCLDTLIEDIRYHLLNSEESILTEYEASNILRSSSRIRLVKLVVELMTNVHGFYPSREEKVLWARATALLFPNLCEGKNPNNIEIFYDAVNRGGYFAHRLRTINRVAGNTSRHETHTQAPTIIESCSHDDKVKWLQHADPSTQRDEIFEQMESTICCRNKPNVNIIAKFPCFLTVAGLITQDFRLKFPEKYDKFVANINDIVDNTVRLAEEKQIKIYNDFTPSQQKWERITTAILYLGKMFTPRTTATKCFDLIRFQQIGTEIPVSDDQSPFLVAIGSSQAAISKYVIVLNGKQIPIQEETSSTAWDSLFKSYKVFNCDYDSYNRYFLRFMLGAIYETDVNNLTAKMRDIKARLNL